MKILQINAVYKNGGSTGRITYELKKIIEKSGNEAFVAFGFEYLKTNDINTYKIENILELKYSILKTRLFGMHGFYNISSTKKMLKWISKINPDIIHLHNLHCHYMNLPLLFDYIKKNNIPVVWTLHDCWAFTGWCAHFDYINCEKWKTQCYHCKLKHSYPFTWFFDRSYTLYKKKKEIVNGVSNMIIITPSLWLANKVKDSFLNRYPIKVINNGIDLDIFKPSPSDFKEKYNLKNEKIVLAVANGFTKNKGIDFILRLPDLLPENYVVVIVGLQGRKIKKFRGISIDRIDNVYDLAKIYSAADVFINPTLEDTFPTTNIEAIACGTPVITYKTGGSPESINQEVGVVVEKGNEEEFVKAIKNIEKNIKISANCRMRALEYYDKNQKYEEYIEIYKKLYEVYCG